MNKLCRHAALALLVFALPSVAVAAPRYVAVSGAGTITDAAGIKTEGTYKDGILVGKFSITMPDRSKFEGTYVDGKLDGPSVWHSPGGARIETSYRAGAETGRRVTTYADGSRLVLDIASDVPGSRAVYTGADGRRIAGRYRPAMEDPAAHAPPPYPSLSRRLNEQGTVLVSFLITDEGYVLDAALRRSAGTWRLDDAALFAVTRWHYRPAMVGRHRIAEIRTVAIPFAFKYVEPLEYHAYALPVTP
jgi:TonB family protein